MIWMIQIISLLLFNTRKDKSCTKWMFTLKKRKCTYITHFSSTDIVYYYVWCHGHTCSRLFCGTLVEWEENPSKTVHLPPPLVLVVSLRLVWFVGFVVGTCFIKWDLDLERESAPHMTHFLSPWHFLPYVSSARHLGGVRLRNLQIPSSSSVLSSTGAYSFSDVYVSVFVCICVFGCVFGVCVFAEHFPQVVRVVSVRQDLFW